MDLMNCDLCVIGAGPGGYVAAIRAAQLGFKTVVVEREFLGGVCLNVGCIPSKAMISAAHSFHKLKGSSLAAMGMTLNGSVTLDMEKLQGWKQSVCDQMASGVEKLLKGNKVTIVRGQARFVTPQEIEISESSGTKRLQAKYFIIATGSRPIEIPGFAFDEESILSSTGALALKSLPKKLTVIGGGYIGLEIGTFLSQLGCKVTVIETLPQILEGVVEPEAARLLQRSLKNLGIDLICSAKAKDFKVDGDHLELSIERQGQVEKVATDKILVCVGRRPNTDQLNLQGIGVVVGEQNLISVNPQCRTSLPHIFAIGDVVAGPKLAHKASFEGVMVAEILAGQNRVYDVKCVPAVMFTDPEIASVGMTEKQCHSSGIPKVLTARFPFGANGRAVTMGANEGFVKVIAHPETHALLGVHIIGPEASNLISEAALAMEMGARLEDLAYTIHPHPTLGEVIMEASEMALGHPIHVIR